jgi:2'-5' RNA ligase
MPELIRTFIAIELPKTVQDGLVQLQARLKKEKPPVRWVAPDKIHVTLHFLGEIPPAEVEAISAMTVRVVAGAAPFEIEATGTGVFPNSNRPRVIWVGIDGDMEKLEALHARLGRELEALGFPLEKRPFSPHLTLGRVRDRSSLSEVRALGTAVGRLEIPSLGRWRVEQILVIRSDLRPEGPTYTPLRVAMLGG